MEKYPIIQQYSSENNSTEQSLSKRRWGNANNSFLLNLIKYRPWLLWISVATFLFTTIYLSLVSLTQTSYVKDEPPPNIVTENPQAKSPQDNAVPLWLFGIVILGGAASTIAIAKCLLNSSHYQRRQERKILLQSQPPTPFIPPVASEEGEASTVSVSPPQPQEQFQVEERILIVFDDKPPNLESPEVQLLNSEILLLPENEWLNLQPVEEPSTTSTESLAEMLDIRKKVPLETLLGESFQRLAGKK